MMIIIIWIERNSTLRFGDNDDDHHHHHHHHDRSFSIQQHNIQYNRATKQQHNSAYIFLFSIFFSFLFFWNWTVFKFKIAFKKKSELFKNQKKYRFFWYYLVRDKVNFLKIKKVLWYYLVNDISYLCTISQSLCSLRINSSCRWCSVIVFGTFWHHQLFHRASMGLCTLHATEWE